MENLETNNQEHLKDAFKKKLNETFDDIENNIKQEISETEGGNSWLDCFATQISKIQLVISQNTNRETFIKISDAIGKGPFGSEEISNIKNKYNDNPSEETKKELIEKLKTYIFEILD